MNKKSPDLIVMGQLGGAHGVRGDVRVRSYTADPQMLFAYGPLRSETGAILLDPVNVRAAKNDFIVTPKQLRQKEAWDALKGARLYVSRAVLPDTEADEFYIDDLVGLQVYAGGNSAIGRIKAVLNHGAGDLLEISLSARSDSVLIPFTEIDVPTVDIGLGRVIVGDIDIWTDSAADEGTDDLG